MKPTETKRQTRPRFLRRTLALCLGVLLLCSAGLLAGCGGERIPDASVKPLIWGVGTVLPSADDFIVSMEEGTVASLSGEYHFTKLNVAYPVTVTVTGKDGATRTLETSLTLIEDTEAPIIRPAAALSTYLGEGVSYRAGVTVTDNCDGEITVRWNTSAVDLQKVGEYPVYYTATDAVGNVSQPVAITLYVYEEKATWEKLSQALERHITSVRSSNLQTELRNIFLYVNSYLTYSGESDKSDWMQAAYNGLISGEGDCYTYYALSKAFFEYFGIENLTVERPADVSARFGERHYWNLVNIGTKDEPKWYHFDACRLKNATHEGWLLTDAQLKTIENGRKKDGVAYFYAFDPAAYPARETIVLNRTVTE